jgi:hypothetical protein
MNDVAAITSTMMAMSHSQTQNQISMSILKLNAQAEQVRANMVMQNAFQNQTLSNSSRNLIDLYV